MMHPMKRVMILLIAAFGMLNAAVAARIAIRLDPVVTVNASHITANVEAYNWGDETADQLRVDITFNEATFEAAPIAHLPFGQTTHTTLALGPSPATPGIYPVITRVRYTDAKGYPVSKIKVITVTTGTNAPPPAELPVTLTLETSPLKRGGTGEIVIVAESAQAITGTLQLYLPDELICDEPKTSITIQQGETLRLPFTIHNVECMHGIRLCRAKASSSSYLEQIRSGAPFRP